MKLFLSSAGLKDEFKQDFLDFLGKDPKECKVAFVPTACDPEPDKSYVKWTTDQLEDAGFPWYEVDLKGESEQSLRERLAPADIVMVNGGNTFYLLDQARKSGFVNIVDDLLQSDKIYFGISAGSYLACPTIEAALWKHLGDENVVGVVDYKALGLVDFLMVAHYEEKWKADVEVGVQATGYPVVTLTNEQAIMVENNKIQIVGTGISEKFNGFEESV